MFASIELDLQELAKKVCFEKVPTEVSADELARQWACSEDSPIPWQYREMQNFEQRKRHFLERCQTYDMPKMDTEYRQFLINDKQIWRSVRATREIVKVVWYLFVRVCSGSSVRTPSGHSSVPTPLNRGRGFFPLHFRRALATCPP